MQQMEKMGTDRIIVGLQADAAFFVSEMMPIAEHRPQGCKQPIGDIARRLDRVIVRLRQQTAEC